MFLGAVVVLRGEVIQVIEDGLNVMLRINVTHGKYDIWKDTVLVYYSKGSSSESRILEKDIVRFWGGFAGIESYKSIFGQTIQIPAIVARVITVDRPSGDRVSSLSQSSADDDRLTNGEARRIAQLPEFLEHQPILIRHK
jgi:hypothetical protein